MSREAEQMRFEEAFLEEHDIMGKLEDVQYDELLLQFLHDHPKYLKEWLLENPGARAIDENSQPLEDMPQSLYRELICWFRSSQLRIDQWVKWLEARIPALPEPSDYDTTEETEGLR